MILNMLNSLTLSCICKTVLHTYKTVLYYPVLHHPQYEKKQSFIILNMKNSLIT